MLEELKAKYGKVFTITVSMNEDDANDTVTLYLKKPDRVTRSLIGRLAMQDGLKAVEATLKNLNIGNVADLNRVLANDDALVSCEEAIVEMLSVQKAILKKN
jgi:hypothetical protein